MKIEKHASLLLLVLMVWMGLILGGCASNPPGTYPSLKQTQIHVSWPMTSYRNAAAFGGLTLGQRERVDAAYAAYQNAFNEALQAAHGNYDAPAPENVKALATELIGIISSLS